MELSVYAHPWDLETLEGMGGLRRLRDLGFSEVALAASYHAGRWLTPWDPRGLVRFLEDGTVHYRPRSDYGRLKPLPSSEVGDGPSPLARLCDRAKDAGMRTRAWTVAFHNSRLGRLHPECAAQNALGDPYTYSLCPANPDVALYAVNMVQDLAAHAGLDTIELEAFGWMGHRHNGHHEKNSFPTDGHTDMLLSLCFCSHCSAGMVEAAKAKGRELDVAALRDQVKGLLRSSFAEADCMAPRKLSIAEAGKLVLDQLGAETLEAVTAQRLVTLVELGGRCALLARHEGVRLAVNGAWDGLRGGPQMPLAVLGPMADEAVFTCYGEGPDGIAKCLPGVAKHVQRRPGAKLRLCIHPRAPQFASDEDLVRVRALATEHGVGSIAVYHLGLLPWPTIERVARVLRQ